MANILNGVELFAVGRWNGFEFTLADLEQIAETYSSLNSVLRVPLKFGHNDEQPVTDGHPALGWASNVRVENNKLIADFIDVPDVVYAAIENRLYSQVSIELDLDVDYKEKNYPFVLTGVALLGADLPAVNTLADLHSYLPGKNPDDAKSLRASRSFVFTVTKQQKQETLNMSITKEEFEALKAEFSKEKEARAKLEQERAEFKAKAEQAAAEIKAQKEAQAKLAFDTKKAGFSKNLEDMVRRGDITPAQRDGFLGQVVEGDQATIENAEKMAALFAKAEQDKSSPTARQGDAEQGSADQILLSRVRQLRSSPDGAALSFSAAADRVMAADKALAAEYVKLTGEV